MTDKEGNWLVCGPVFLENIFVVRVDHDVEFLPLTIGFPQLDQYIADVLNLFGPTKVEFDVVALAAPAQLCQLGRIARDERAQVSFAVCQIFTSSVEIVTSTAEVRTNALNVAGHTCEFRR